jgi:hypothetical protein
MRIARLVAIALTLFSLGTLGAPASGNAASTPPAAQVASIDLGGLFGDENEADENEPDEGSKASAQNGAGTSFTQLLLALGLGIVATIFAARWFFRARSWVRQLGRGKAT